MTRVVPYNVSMLPGGSVNADRATAADFGGDLGLRTLGQGLGNLGQDIDQTQRAQEQVAYQVQLDQGRIWASTAAAQAEVQTRQQLQQHIDSLDPSAPNYPQQVSELTANADDLWQQKTADLQAAAPNHIAGRMIAETMSRGRVGFTSRAMETQANLNAGYTTNMVIDGVKANTDLIAASPDNDTYARIVQQNHDSIMGLDTIDPNTKLKLAENSEHQFALTQVQSFASQNPSAFLQSVNVQGGVQTRGGSVKGAVPDGSGSAPQGSGFLAALPAETRAYVPGVLKRLGGANPLNPDGTASQALVKAVIGQESGGNAGAVSGKGATGMMQVMPATAASIGFPNADLTDPAQNVSIGTLYLNQQLKKYGGDVSKALAAYNAGPGAVDEALAPSTLPQVQPLGDQQIAAAKVPIAGWNKLTWPEKVSAVRQAEGLMGKQLADDRGATTSALQDAFSALQHGVADPNIASDPRFSEEHLVQLYGPDEGHRKRTELVGVANMAQDMKGLATMPDAQVEATVKNAFANAGGEGADVLAPAADRLSTAAQAVMKQRSENPLAFAGAYGMAGYKDLDWSDPSKLQAGLPGRIATARTMMNEFGAKPEVFTQADVAQAQTALAKLAPQDRVNYLAGIVRGISDPQLENVALHQVFPKGDSTMMTAVHMALTTGGVTLPDGSVTSNRETADMIAEGYSLLHPNGVTGNEKATDPNNPASPAVPVGRGVFPLDKAKFDAAFSEAVGGRAAFAGPNAGYSGRVAQETYDAVKAYYVADAFHNRGDVANPSKEDIARAVTAVTGGVWKRGNGDALFAPQGMPMDQFQDQLAGRAMQALQAAGFDGTNAAWQFDRVNLANWGNGKYVFMLGGRPLVSPTTGQTIVLDYSQPYGAATPGYSAATGPSAHGAALDALRAGVR